MRILFVLGTVLLVLSCRGGYGGGGLCAPRCGTVTSVTMAPSPGSWAQAAPAPAAVADQPVAARPPVVAKGAPAAKPPAGIPDSRIGLDQHRITDVPPALGFTYDDTPPSGSKALDRAWHGMPPVVPHGIQDLLPITAEENACLECHDPTNPDREADDGKPIPKSHFMDYRASPVVQRPKVVGARYNCILCHEQRTDAKPIVGNDYRR